MNRRRLRPASYIKLGNTGLITSALGLGCTGMSGMYGDCDREEALATIRAAMEAGVIARHGRRLRHGPQRDADRGGAEGGFAGL